MKGITQMKRAFRDFTNKKSDEISLTDFEKKNKKFLRKLKDESKGRNSSETNIQDKTSLDVQQSSSDIPTEEVSRDKQSIQDNEDTKDLKSPQITDIKQLPSTLTKWYENDRAYTPEKVTLTENEFQTL